MGDVIHLLNEITIHHQKRITDKGSSYEFVLIYPDYCDMDNLVVNVGNDERVSNHILEILLNDINRKFKKGFKV
jgi:hypothetical protein